MRVCNRFPNIVREIWRHKTARRIPKENRRPGIRLNRSNELNVACRSRWILEVLAKCLVGRVNALESLFRFQSLGLVALKSVGMPELRRRAIRLVQRRLRLRRMHDSKSSGMLKTVSAHTRHALASLTQAAGNQRSLRSLSSSCCASSRCFFKPSTMCGGAFASKARIVELPLGVRDDLFLFRDLLCQLARVLRRHRSCARKPPPHQPEKWNAWLDPAEIWSTNRTSLTRARRSTSARFSLTSSLQVCVDANFNRYDSLLFDADLLPQSTDFDDKLLQKCHLALSDA